MKFGLLSILAVKPTHGYDLRHELETGFAGVWSSVNGGQVYTTLARLERDGFVVSEAAADADGRGKRVYAATQLGRDELFKWLTDGQLEPIVGGELFSKILAAKRTGIVDPAEILNTSRLECLQRLASIRRSPPVEIEANLLSDWIALRLDADLRWIDQCDEWLASQDLGGQTHQSDDETSDHNRSTQ